MDTAYTLAYTTQGADNMIDLNQGGSLDVTLKEDAQVGTA